MTLINMKVLNIGDLYHSDLDEFLNENDIWDENANCANTDGSYTCECDKGYTGDGNSCAGEYQQWQVRLNTNNKMSQKATPGGEFFKNIHIACGASDCGEPSESQSENLADIESIVCSKNCCIC